MERLNFSAEMGFSIFEENSMFEETSKAVFANTKAKLKVKLGLGTGSSIFTLKNKINKI